MKRIYIAGPMTGLPDLNYPAFNAQAERLRGEGYHVENPAENPECDSWAGYMRMAIAQLITCDEILLLPGYVLSKGAMLEIQIASALGLHFIPLEPEVLP